MNAPHSRSGSTPLSMRSRFAVAAGLLAATMSRKLGRGSGGMVGGRVALVLAPNALPELAAGKRIVLVTGTNGKSTTTRMTAAAIGTVGSVAANLGGDNMTTGITAALMNHPESQFAVLEVDEMHLPHIVRQVHPAAIILLNLSRDQLDRVGEIGVVEGRIREAVDAAPDALIVANCDDPLICSAAWDAKNVEWVSVGAPWKADSASFPRTGTLVLQDSAGWRVSDHPEYSRPEPKWTISQQSSSTWRLEDRQGVEVELDPRLPGRANVGNAAQAAVAALGLGAEPQLISKAIHSVTAVAGRYQTYDVDGRSARLLLAKNPAGWQEALTMVPRDAAQVVIVVNGQVPDGEDLSWLWDVDFSALRAIAPELVIAAGERAADLAVRLEYEGIAHRVIPAPVAAIRSCEPGDVEVVANYTAFRDLKWDLEHL